MRSGKEIFIVAMARLQLEIGINWQRLSIFSLVEPIAWHTRIWRAYWRHGAARRGTARHGAALAEADTAAVAIVEAIGQRLRTGRPLAADAWIAAQEEVTGRAIARRKPGPKTREPN
jgi:putative transposase